MSLLRSPTALALTAAFGLQSMTAYVQMGWLPRIYADAGLPAATAGVLTALIAALGIIGGFLMPTAVARSRHLVAIIGALGVITAAGYAGLLVAPAGEAICWALLLGIGGWIFPASIALIPARSTDPLVTARLSGMVQPLGYVLAAIGPFAVGALHERTAGWSVVLLGLIAAALAMGVLGMRAARPGTVDQELAGAMAVE